MFAKAINTNFPMNEIPSYIYTKIAEPLSHIVSDWFNKSVTTGEFFFCLKKARIVPVFKGGTNTVVKKYRPICIVSFITKVFEKL